jgi:hypothetical protein
MRYQVARSLKSFVAADSTLTRMTARRLSNVAHSEPAVATATSQELYWLDEGSLFYY